MNETLRHLYGTELSVQGISFKIDEAGNVSTPDFKDLGHLEECLMNGFTIYNLFEATASITL